MTRVRWRQDHVAGDEIGAYDAADGAPRWVARVSDEGGRGPGLRTTDPAASPVVQLTEHTRHPAG